MQGVILDAATLGDADLSCILENGDDWQVYQQTKPDEVLARIKAADIVLSNKVEINAEVMAACTKLKLIAVTATGTNNVDLDAATEHRVFVCNVRGYGSGSVAQHTIGLMLNLATQMPAYIDDIRQGEWQRRAQVTLLHRPIFELAGKRLGIIGYGQLGQAVAKVAFGFDMEIVAAESSNRKTPDPKTNRLPLAELLSTSDFVSLHCPLNETNFQFINDKTLGQMKRNSFLINTARGGLVDSQALIKALRDGTIAGAALDVLPEEPPIDPEPLLEAQRVLPNLLITPHNAWGAKESRQRLVNQVADVLTSFHAGEPMNLVT